MQGKIYISGKISGIENKAFEIFEMAEKELQLRGFKTINPMKLDHDHDKTWDSYIKEDIKHLLECNSIYMLNNWNDSKGATIEHSIAILLDYKIEYQ